MKKPEWSGTSPMIGRQSSEPFTMAAQDRNSSAPATPGTIARATQRLPRNKSGSTTGRPRASGAPGQPPPSPAECSIFIAV